MIVVADTSVILNLCRVGQADLLVGLFQEVAIPGEVRDEFTQLSQGNPRFRGLALPGWVRVQQPNAVPTELRGNPRLDLGETAAIALALELAVVAILIDESEGRRAARRLGLQTIGVIGVLLRARQVGLLPAVKPVLEQLEKEANFWVGPELRIETLRLAGETQ